MFRHRSRREVPALDTTSTADISFMLLVFFFVTSSMDTDMGLLRQLPPMDDTTEHQVVDVKREDVLTVRLDATDHMTCNDEPLTPTELTQRVRQFVKQGRLTHIISVQADRQTSYNAYFQMQNAIVAAYNGLRDEQARRQFGRSFASCTLSQKNTVADYYPQRISESQPVGEEGGQR